MISFRLIRRTAFYENEPIIDQHVNWVCTVCMVHTHQSAVWNMEWKVWSMEHGVWSENNLIQEEKKKKLYSKWMVIECKHLSKQDSFTNSSCFVYQLIDSRRLSELVWTVPCSFMCNFQLIIIIQLEWEWKRKSFLNRIALGILIITIRWTQTKKTSNKTIDKNNELIRFNFSKIYVTFTVCEIFAWPGPPTYF